MRMVGFNSKKKVLALVAAFIAPVLLSLSIPVQAENLTAETAKARNLLLAAAGKTEVVQNDGRHDYDFFTEKKWTLKGRKRVGRFVGSQKFEEMDGIETSYKIGDIGMLAELSFPDWRPGYKLNILRIFDTTTKKWYIYDIDDHGGNESPPLVGAFHDGLGIFVGKDKINGVDVMVRYTSTADAVHPRFMQEFSNDGGKTWEVDWNMEFTEIK